MRFKSGRVITRAIAIAASGGLVAVGFLVWAGANLAHRNPAAFQAAFSHVAAALTAAGCTAGALAAALVRYNRVHAQEANLEAFSSLSQIHGEIQTLTEERAAATRKLEEQEHLLHAVLSAIEQGVFWKDAKGVYRGCNARFARWMGYERTGDVIGKTDQMLVKDRREAEFRVRCDGEVMKTGIGLLDMTETVTMVSGARVDLLVSKLPLRDAEGRVVGVIGVGREATEGKRPDKSKDMGGGLSMAIDCMQEGVVIIDVEGVITETNDYYAALMRKPVEILRGQHLAEVLTYPADQRIGEILGRFERTTTRPHAEAFCVCLGEKDHCVRVQPLWRGSRYEGAVINIIDVSELTQARGRAEHTSCRRDEFLASISHQIRTPLNNIAGFAELLGQETLTPEQKRFVDLIASSANSIRQVVEEVISRDHQEEFVNGNGIRQSDGKQDAEAAHDEEAHDHGATSVDNDEYVVLVVDDVPENRMLLEVLLKRQGYSTVECRSGSEAVKLCAERRFDLILMDIQMADMDGLESTRAIRADGANTRTPILAMTASTSREDEEKCLEAGCDDLVRKPIRKEALIRKVWRFIEQQKQMRTAREGGEIVSFLSDNPDYQKTIETFVENLPQRIPEMQQALDAENLHDLAFKVHVLKGLGGFAGFPIYTELAKSLEQAIQGSQMAEIRQKLDEMVALCQRTRLARWPPRR